MRPARQSVSWGRAGCSDSSGPRAVWGPGTSLAQGCISSADSPQGRSPEHGEDRVQKQPELKPLTFLHLHIFFKKGTKSIPRGPMGVIAQVTSVSLIHWTGLQAAGGPGWAVPSGPEAPMEDGSPAGVTLPVGGASLLPSCGQLSRARLLVLGGNPTGPHPRPWAAQAGVGEPGRRQWRTVLLWGSGTSGQGGQALAPRLQGQLEPSLVMGPGGQWRWGDT